MTGGPSRDDAVTTRPSCAGCGSVLPIVRGRQRYCSPACRQRAYRGRSPHRDEIAPGLLRPVRPQRATGVYQCPDCQTRYLAQQRCPDCNIFCTRLGTGGACPCCEEPITIDELLPTLPR